VLIICLLLIVPPLYQIKPAYSARTILVTANFPTIQEAVDNATAGDTIQVAPGIYYEHVVVTKSLTIIGENPETTIVDGTANGTVFNLEASNVYLTGFTIRNAGNDYNAIVSEREMNTNDDHQIVNNIITTSQYGVSLSYSKGNTIFNNTFINNPFDGIFLYRADNTNITANTITDSAYGIQVTYSTSVTIIGNTISQTSYAIYLIASSTGSTISHNILSGKTIGIYSSSDSTTADHNTIIDGAFGIYFYNCSGGSIYYNTLFMNKSFGIRLYMPAPTTSGHNINNNKILNADWAIELVLANGNTFTGNWIQQNTWGIFMYGSSSNTVYHNNFIQNNMQASSGPGNLWDQDGEGNYWSDYEGTDDDGDGIGDTSYRIMPLGYDYFPLMTTWSEHDISIQNVTLSTNETSPNAIVNITVIVKNRANTSVSETFNVTAKYDLNIIETKTVNDLAQGATQTLTFNWNTTGVAAGNYTIRAEASPVPDELNTDNNKLIDGMVYIMPVLTGDVNGDGIVDIFDMGEVSAHWYPGPPEGPLGYNPDADLNNDGNVDILDMRIVSDHMGETA